MRVLGAIGVVECHEPVPVAAVPVPGRSGIIGVILLEKPSERGFAPADRDLLVAYADRLGAAIESQEISADVEALESMGDLGSPAPVIHICDRNLRLQYLAGTGLNFDDAIYIFKQIIAFRKFPDELLVVSGAQGRALRAFFERTSKSNN